MLYQGSQLSLELLEPQCAHLCFDAADRPVNVFNHKTGAELKEALTLLESRSDIKGLLVSSAKSGFIAGADINEFAPTFHAGAVAVKDLLDRSNSNFNRLESLPFPVVVAINGFALGGGCEFSLACDYRIGDDTTKMGLPETRLGIIPGWGGTVRLPRIAGIETAVEWIATGKEQSAVAAFKCGVLDGIATSGQILDVAKKTLMQCVSGELEYKKRRQQKQSPLKHNDIELTMALTTSLGFVAAQAGKHYPAPIAAVKTIQKAARSHRDEALAFETETFIAMTQTSQALALSGIFISDQFVSKKAKGWAKKTDQSVQRAAVIGAGIMGGGIAYQSALKNIPIKMKDIAQTGLDLGLSEANKILSKRVERGRLSVSAAGEVLNRIEPTLGFDGFTEIDIVIEAVVENPKVKGSVLKELEKHVSVEAVLTSNTSTISINALAKNLARPENFCGMHFFNPVHAMPLVEVIRGEKTSDKTIALTVAYASAMGKKAIVVNDCAGFLVNRVLFPYFAAFLLLLKDGARFEQIDQVMEAWGWPMGPAYLMDVIGIDTAVHAEAVMAKAFPERMGRDYPAATDWLFEQKHLGQKTGQGFYQYETNKKGKLDKKVNKDIAEKVIEQSIASNQASVEPMQFSDEDIVMRMMAPMVNELAHCLEEGIVDSASEADMALVYGLGFPPFRGGGFRWVDDIGVESYLASTKALATLGAMYHPTVGMEQQQSKGELYYPVLGLDSRPAATGEIS